MTTSAPVTIAISSTGGGFGTLGPPIASPSGGIYPSNQVVTLVAVAGATIHYTTGVGQVLTTSSPLYTGPITLTQNTTLRAIAIQTGWTQSAEMTQVYQIDTTPPTITTRLWPSPTTAGWNNTPVQVTFSCTDASGIASCPAPVTVTQEGAGLLVSGTATDNAGHSTTATVTVNIDVTPAVVTVTNPAAAFTTGSGIVSLTGTVTDGLSGIAVATCNGVPATVSGNGVDCIVALSPGRNAIVLHALDAAGNAMSAGVSVTRTGPLTALELSPGTRTLLTGEVASLVLTDRFGISPPSATWDSSDPGIVTTDANGILTAIAPGEAIITASAGGVSTTATITVVTGTTLPSGSTRWTVPTASGFHLEAPIYAHRVDDSVPDLFAVEQDDNWSAPPTIKALTASGETLWTHVAPGIPAPGTPVFGDSFGGLVVELLDENSGDSYALARFAGPASTPPWRYEPLGTVGEAAQAPDGTIYALELSPAVGRRSERDLFVVVIDGHTSQVRARVPIPRTVQTHDVTSAFANCPSRHDVDEFTPASSLPVVAADGSAYLQVAYMTRMVYGRRQNGNCAILNQTKNVTHTLALLHIQPTGASSSEILYEFQFSGIYGACEWEVRTDSVVPDGLGGVIATWDRLQSQSFCNAPMSYHQFATRFDAAGGRSDYLLSNNEVSKLNIVLVGDEGTAYLAPTDETTLSAFDVVSGTTTWTIDWSTTGDNFGRPAMALAGGGIAVHHPFTSAMTVLDSSGLAVETQVMTVSNPTSILQFGRWEGLDLAGLSSVTGPELHESPYSYQREGGNAQGAYAPRTTHSSIDRAAVAMLRYYNPTSIETNREFGGSICTESAGTYFGSFPNVGIGYSDSVIPTGCAGTRVGHYHTHSRHGNDGFSGIDINIANNDNFGDFYVKYFVATPCGKIFKYVGPSTNPIDEQLSERTQTPLTCTP